MKTLKVEFNESEISNLVDQICEVAEHKDECHERSGHEFMIKFNYELSFIVKVLIFDSYDVRHVSTDINLITVEGFYTVESNINYEVEDKVNKALIAEFHKNR